MFDAGGRALLFFFVHAAFVIILPFPHISGRWLGIVERMTGVRLRCDVVEVYLWRQPTPGQPPQFLQIRRARDPLAGTWQPVMGHIRPEETFLQAALREIEEETGYAPGRGLLKLWQLEPVNVYFLARQDCLMLSPGFAAQVASTVQPQLNAEHDAFRWIPADQAPPMFLWPGQSAAVQYILAQIIPPGPAEPFLRIPLPL